jgi:hypothetical protein
LNEKVREVGAEEAYTRNQFRESRAENGELAFLSLEEERRLLESLPLIDVSDSAHVSGAR